MLKDMDSSKLPSNYKEYNLTVNKNKIKGYKYKPSSTFYLISGINLEIIKLDTYQGDVAIKGKIDSIIYKADKSKKNKEESIFSKLFK